MSTEQLDKILNTELHKEPVNGDAVRLIMNVLWEREKDMPVEITPEIQRAWDKYQHDIAQIREETRRECRRRSWLIRSAVAAVTLVVLLVPIIPQETGAESLWDRLASWTEDIFAFSNPTAADKQQDQYAFTTEIDGLQQIYDAVAALGVERPMVPSWLPGEPELAEIKTVSLPAQKMVKATLENDDGEILFNISIYNSNVDSEYPKDDIPVYMHEKAGVTYNIMRNKEVWVVAWCAESIEYFFALDCQEDILYKVIESIYMTEAN